MLTGLLNKPFHPCSCRPPLCLYSRSTGKFPYCTRATPSDQNSSDSASSSPLTAKSQESPLLTLKPQSLLSPFVGVLEGSFLVGALSIQLLLLKSARSGQHVLARGEVSLILLTLAVVLRFLHQLWSNGSRDPTSILGGAVSSSGAVRLHRLEILHTRQAAALSGLEKELSRIRLRMHGISKDIQPALRQAQAESAVHADGLVSVSKRLEALGDEIEDTRGLLSELQGASLKQLQLVVQAIKLAQAASKPSQMPNK